MLWVPFLLVGVNSLEMSEPNEVAAVSDCLQFISKKFLESRCLSFLFPFNFSNPSVAEVHTLVRSPLLKSVHNRWAPYLPKMNSRNMNLPYMKPEKGPVRYLNCAHIIIFDDDLSYIVQADRILYTFYSHYYEDAAAGETRMVVAVLGEVRETEVYQLLFYMYKMGDVDVVFVGKREGVITVFTIFPFGKDRNSCPEDNSMVEILDVWINGSFAHNTNLFPNKVPRIFNNCSFKVGTVDTAPYFVFNDEGKPSAGIEFYMIEMIADHMGLRPDYLCYRNKTKGWLWIEKDGPHGVSVDLRRGEVWILVSGNNNLIFTYSSIVVPHSFLVDHLSWFFKNPEEVPTWKLLFLGFDKLLWVLVFAAIIIFPYCLFFIAKAHCRNHPFQKLSTSFITSYGLVVAMGSNVEPKTNVLRIVIASWFFYAIHINLAYSTVLTSLMTTGKMEPMITSFEQMLELNMKTVMERLIDLDTLDIDVPLIRKVLSQRVVNNDFKSVLEGVMKWNNASIMRRALPFMYIIKKQNLELYVADSLYLGFDYIGFKLRRNHFALERFAELSSRVFECGLTSKFIKDYTTIPKKVTESSSKAFTLLDIIGAFIILLAGYVLSFVVLLVELIVDLYKKKIQFYN